MDKAILNQALAFIGKKMDDVKDAVLSKSVNVDIGKSSEIVGKEIAKSLDKKLGVLTAEIKSQTSVLGKNREGEVIVAINELRGELSKKKLDVKVGAPVIEMSPVTGKIDELVKVMSGKKTDNSDVIKAVQAVTKEVASIKIPTIESNKSELVMINKSLEKVLSAVNANKPEKLAEKFDELDVVFKGLKPKDSTKFDDQQMKGLMAALTNIGTAGGVKSASEFVIEKFELTLADTEYAYTFPRGTVSWTFKLREAGQSLFYASETGKLPVSGDDSQFMTLLPGLATHSQDNVEYGGKKMFFECDGAGQIIELMVSKL